MKYSVIILQLYGPIRSEDLREYSCDETAKLQSKLNKQLAKHASD